MRTDGVLTGVHDSLEKAWNSFQNDVLPNYPEAQRNALTCGFVSGACSVMAVVNMISVEASAHGTDEAVRRMVDLNETVMFLREQMLRSIEERFPGFRSAFQNASGVKQ
jgi:hypothetical protein